MTEVITGTTRVPFGEGFVILPLVNTPEACPAIQQAITDNKIGEDPSDVLLELIGLEPEILKIATKKDEAAHATELEEGMQTYMSEVEAHFVKVAAEAVLETTPPVESTTETPATEAEASTTPTVVTTSAVATPEGQVIIGLRAATNLAAKMATRSSKILQMLAQEQEDMGTFLQEVGAEADAALKALPAEQPA